MIKNFPLIGFKMLGEWEKQDSIWITWPHNRKDWPGLFKFIPKTFAEIISAISRILSSLISEQETLSDDHASSKIKSTSATTFVISKYA